MTKNITSSYVRRLSAAAAGAAALFAATAANAQCGNCRGDYEPGLLAYIAKAFTSTAATDCVRCVPDYQGDYMVNQGPVYSGPAVIAPQHTYAPTPTAAGYPYVPGYAATAAEAEPALRQRIYPGAPPRRVVKKRPVRKVAKVEVGPSGKKGAPQIIRARAEVRIYGPERMDIRLYRTKK